MWEVLLREWNRRGWSVDGGVGVGARGVGDWERTSRPVAALGMCDCHALAISLRSQSAIKRGDAVGEALDSLAPEDVLAMAGRASDACGTKRCYLCGHTSYGTEGEVGSPATQCCWRKDSKAERCQNFGEC